MSMILDVLNNSRNNKAPDYPLAFVSHVGLLNVGIVDYTNNIDLLFLCHPKNKVTFKVNSKDPITA